MNFAAMVSVKPEFCCKVEDRVGMRDMVFHSCPWEIHQKVTETFYLSLSDVPHKPSCSAL